MFAGIGGFRSGLSKFGDFFMPIGFCEIDPYARQAYEAIYDTKGELFFEDARKIVPEDLPDIDLICGGFPCQSFSIAGKRGGFEDARGTLFFEIARIARVKRPKYLLLENVPGLLSHDSGRTFVSYEMKDENTVILRKEKICDGCKHPDENEGSILDVVNSLTETEQKALHRYLSIKLSAKEHTDKLLILHTDALAEDYKKGEYQYFYANGGNGCRPTSLGRKIFGFFVSDGEKTQFVRGDFIGIADPEQVPDWVNEKLAVFLEEQQNTEEGGLTLS